MANVKYIYFEIYEVQGSNPEPKRMQNENILELKPHTNSRGVWGFRHVTERHGFDLPTHVVVDQYWIDLEKYDFKDSYSELVKECLSKFTDPVAEKVKQILEEIFEEDSNGEDVESVKIEGEWIHFDVYDRHREGTFSNKLKKYPDGTVTCWRIHEIWEGGDVDSSIERELTKFFKFNDSRN